METSMNQLRVSEVGKVRTETDQARTGDGRQERSGIESNSDNGRQGEPAAQVELSSAALDQTRAANRASAAAAALGLNAVEAAQAAVSVGGVDGSSALDGVEDVGTGEGQGNPAAEVAIGPEARRMALEVSENQRNGVSQAEDSSSRQRVEQRMDTSLSVEQAGDPGISADQLGTVVDAGRPS